MSANSEYSSETFAEFYDHLSLYTDRADADFYVAEAVAARGPVLELGCGTGRVLLRCARTGVTITGLDSSEAMLARCQQKLLAEPAEVQQRVTLRQRDMCDFRIDETFQLVTIPFRPFQHLIEVEEQLACLRCIREALAPGGRLILDVFNPSLPLLVDEQTRKEHSSSDPFTLPDGRHVARMERILTRDFTRQLLQIELIHYVTHLDGRQERLVQPLSMRYFFRYELEHLLARSGFELERAYGDFERSPISESACKELIYVARKSTH